jgi:predicted phage tail protein
MLRQIKLYGLAAKTFGPSFEVDVASLAEATRALCVQIKGFRAFIEKHHFRVVCGKSLKKGWGLGEAEITFMLPDGDIHVVPVLKGAKSGGIGKIIAGVVLLAAAFFIPIAPALGGLASALGGTTALAGTSGFIGSLAAAGIGMIVAGVTTLMTKTTKPTEAKDDKSFTIDGQLNVQEQGGAVPLIYGLTMVGSTLISAGVSTSEYSAGGTVSTGTTPIGTRAAGSVNFVNKASVGDAVNLNGLMFTFVDVVAYRGQVAIGNSLSASLNNLINAIYAIEDIRVAGASYAQFGNSMQIVFKTPGRVGNGYWMAVSSSVISISAGALTGGAD